MRRKDEERLMELAFGELSAEEATRLEAELDAEASRTVWAYRDVRDGLRALGDVPENQLSKERLRDAILQRGLSERKATVTRPWLWIPGTACALVLAALALREVPGPDASVPTDMLTTQPAVTMAAAEEPEVTFESLDLPAPVLQVNVVSSEATPQPMVARAGDGRSRDRRTALRPRNSAGYVALNRPAQPIRLDPPPVVTAESMMAVDEEPRLEYSGSSAPIVLIAAEKDSTTGTQVATEVESASNVLVGG